MKPLKEAKLTNTKGQQDNLMFNCVLNCNCDVGLLMRVLEGGRFSCYRLQVCHNWIFLNYIMKEGIGSLK